MLIICNYIINTAYFMICSRDYFVSIILHVLYILLYILHVYLLCTRFNDMDADSAAEDDEDYKMSDEANEDEGPSVGSDENVSDDIWTPGGIRKGGRKYTPREKVRDFSKCHL